MTTRRKYLHTMALAIPLALLIGASDVQIRAQAQPPAPPPSPQVAPKSPGVPGGALSTLQVQVVISRFQGEKKIGSLPYTLAVNAYAPSPFPARTAQLKMDSSVPIVSPHYVQEAPANQTAPSSSTGSNLNVSYQNIGTQIDCSAVQADGGRFELNISVQDNSVYVDDQAVTGVSKRNEPPIVRSFRSRNDLILRDGQSIQFTAAADRISGEVIKIDVTLNVLK